MIIKKVWDENNSLSIEKTLYYFSKIIKILQRNKIESEEILPGDSKSTVQKKIQKIIADAAKTKVKVKIKETDPIDVNIPNPINAGINGGKKVWGLVTKSLVVVEGDDLNDLEDQKKSMDKMTKEIESIGKLKSTEIPIPLQSVLDDFEEENDIDI